jgi:hypothetical protein
VVCGAVQELLISSSRAELCPKAGLGPAKVKTKVWPLWPPVVIVAGETVMVPLPSAAPFANPEATKNTIKPRNTAAVALIARVRPLLTNISPELLSIFGSKDGGQCT